MPENDQQNTSESRLSGPDSPEIIRSEVLADLFEASAAKVPEKPALLFADRQLTYGELNAAADRVAAHA
jgi:non-ribosomal peptide synthetase component F